MNVGVPTRREFMKRRFYFAGLGIIAAPATADNPRGSNNAWHQLSDRERGMRLISAALFWNGRYGGECKEWIQKVVKNVTNGHVLVPANTAIVTHRWVSDSSGHILDLGATISSARFGDIVQMVIRDRSGNSIGHTAIIGSNSGSSITWLESNYRGDKIVTVNRVQSHQQFLSSLNGRYTVYRIK
jgi:hypothetical protein